MSYDERIAARIRASLGKRRDVVERKMFGGLTFMVNGAMCCGVTSEALVVRVGSAEYERALAEPRARPMDFTGRPLVGMVYVDPPGYRTAPALSRWVQRGLDFVSAVESAGQRSRAVEHRTTMTRLPTLHGIIRRRILVNWRVDPDVVQRLLPTPFRPKLQGDHAVAGICLIRLEHIRPRFVPVALGVASENAAHRIAVSWIDEEGALREGVYIARRDTGSRLNHWLGGRLFPGEHHHARFEVRDDGGAIDLSMRSLDGEVEIELAGRAHRALPTTSCFGSLDQASAFFQTGSLGYSETEARRHLDGVRLVTEGWSVGALAIDRVRSTFFEDALRFPRGSAELDCALVMRDLAHQWHSAPDFPLGRAS